MTKSKTAAVAGALTLSACSLISGLGPDERRELAFHQRNAQTYWDGGRYDQAWNAVERGLALAPDDYKLRTMQGYLLMQDSARNPNTLERALEVLRDVYDDRSPSDHEGFMLLGIALCHQKLGYRHARLADMHAGEADRRAASETDKTLRLARAQEHRKRAEAHWDEAVGHLGELVARQDILIEAHKHLMEIAAERNQYEVAVEQGNECLKHNHAEQRLRNTRLRETPVYAIEVEERAQLQRLIDQEMRVRSALAEMHYRKANYAASVEQLDEILRLDPRRSVDYYNRARALEELDRKADARRDFERFLSTTTLPPDDERVAHAVEFTLEHGPS